MGSFKNKKKKTCCVPGDMFLHGLPNKPPGDTQGQCFFSLILAPFVTQNATLVSRVKRATFALVVGGSTHLVFKIKADCYSK